MRNLLIILATSFAVTLFAQTPMSVDALLKDAARFDKKDVKVLGTVAKYEEKTSKKGNAYTVFELAGAKGKANVYLRGRPSVKIQNGSKVEICGVYQKKKVMRDFTIENEIDVTSKEDKPYGIKISKN